MKVLIVDDDETQIVLLSFGLKSLGAEVTVARGAAEGLEKALREGPFEAIISDVHMPDDSGLSLLHQLRRSNCETPFFFVSGQRTLDNFSARALGCQGFFQKPVSVRALFQAIQAQTQAS
jgi:CheY-like chemotaxis protein